jgi:hypothetical protein
MRANHLCPGKFDKRSYILLVEKDEGWKYHKDEFYVPDNYLNCMGQGLCKYGMVSGHWQAEKLWRSTLKECDRNSSLNEYDLQTEAANDIDTAGFSSEEKLGTIEQNKPTHVLVSIDVNNILWLLLGFITGCLLAYGYLSKVPSTHSTSLKVRRPEL